MRSVYSCILLTCFLFIASSKIKAQENDKWDNQLFGGNKISWGKDKWKTTGELQFRVKDNMQTLDRWFLETIPSYLASKHWEVSMPFRYSIRPNHNEFRPGLGLFNKLQPQATSQIVQQLMYQADITSIETQHGLRYVVFYNKLIKEKWIPNGAAGLFYRWSDDFTGIQFVRLGAGLTYIVSEIHSINFSYFVGMTDQGEYWTYQGIPFLQLVIKLNGEFEHQPAKYINF